MPERRPQDAENGRLTHENTGLHLVRFLRHFSCPRCNFPPDIGVMTLLVYYNIYIKKIYYRF